MSVTNGQNANQTTFNNAFASKTTDNTLAGKQNITDTTEAGNDSGALRVQGGLYLAKDAYVVGKFQKIGKFVEGFSIDSVADNASTGSDQDVTLTKPYTVFTNNGLASIRNLTYSDITYCTIVVIKNGLSGVLTLVNNAGGTAANRIVTGTGADLEIAVGQSIMLLYDKVNSRWQVIGGTGSGSGGGGGIVLSWEELANSPLKVIENNLATYQFEAGLAQELYTEFRVPDSYVAGTPITLKMKVYSPDTSGDILLKTQSTLLGSASEVTSTTNQRTSTNTAITMTGSIDNIPQEVEFDLTDGSGEINATAVAAGDTIAVRLYRDTDTATSAIRALFKQHEVITT